MRPRFPRETALELKIEKCKQTSCNCYLDRYYMTVKTTPWEFPMSLAQQFRQDSQGRRFTDVMNDDRISFAAVTDFFDDSDRQRRMMESEVHHDRPALSGVICEFESLPEVHNFFLDHDGHETTRFRQAVGVLVRIIMVNGGWRKTGRKGSLGIRKKVQAHTTVPGSYHNNGGLALWFTRAERYERPEGPLYKSIAERARLVEETIAGRTTA